MSNGERRRVLLAEARSAVGKCCAVLGNARTNLILAQLVDDDDRGTGALNNGDPQFVVLSGREYERYLDGALNETAP